MDTSFYHTEQAQNGLLAIPFEYEGKPVRAIKKDDEPWFVAADLCAVLELTNSRMAIQALDDDEKGVSQIYTLGGNQEVSIISEAGMYRLVMRSDKPQARPFQRFVTHDVLPAIRKTGRYEAPNAKPRMSYDQLREMNADTDRLNAISRASTNVPGIMKLLADGVLTQEQADLSISMIVKKQDKKATSKSDETHEEFVLKFIRNMKRWVKKAAITKNTYILETEERNNILKNLVKNGLIECRQVRVRLGRPYEEYRYVPAGHRSEE